MKSEKHLHLRRPYNSVGKAVRSYSSGWIQDNGLCKHPKWDHAASEKRKFPRPLNVYIKKQSILPHHTSQTCQDFSLKPSRGSARSKVKRPRCRLQISDLSFVSSPAFPGAFTSLQYPACSGSTRLRARSGHRPHWEPQFREADAPVLT